MVPTPTSSTPSILPFRFTSGCRECVKYPLSMQYTSLFTLRLPPLALKRSIQLAHYAVTMDDSVIHHGCDGGSHLRPQLALAFVERTLARSRNLMLGWFNTVSPLMSPRNSVPETCLLINTLNVPKPAPMAPIGHIFILSSASEPHQQRGGAVWRQSTISTFHLVGESPFRQPPGPSQHMFSRTPTTTPARPLGSREALDV